MTHKVMKVHVDRIQRAIDMGMVGSVLSMMCADAVKAGLPVDVLERLQELNKLSIKFTYEPNYNG